MDTQPAEDSASIPVTQSAPDPFAIPSRNYRRLLRIAALANAVSWIALVGYGIFMVLMILQDASRYPLTTPYDGNAEFWRTFKQEPLLALYYIFTWLKLPLQGLVSFTVLKGVALGLGMIVETDMNRRKNEEEEGDHDW